MSRTAVSTSFVEDLKLRMGPRFIVSALFGLPVLVLWLLWRCFALFIATISRHSISDTVAWFRCLSVTGYIICCCAIPLKIFPYITIVQIVGSVAGNVLFELLYPITNTGWTKVISGIIVVLATVSSVGSAAMLYFSWYKDFYLAASCCFSGLAQTWLSKHTLDNIANNAQPTTTVWPWLFTTIALWLTVTLQVFPVPVISHCLGLFVILFIWGIGQAVQSTLPGDLSILISWVEVGICYALLHFFAAVCSPLVVHALFEVLASALVSTFATTTPTVPDDLKRFFPRPILWFLPEKMKIAPTPELELDTSSMAVNVSPRSSISTGYLAFRPMPTLPVALYFGNGIRRLALLDAPGSFDTVLPAAWLPTFKPGSTIGPHVRANLHFLDLNVQLLGTEVVVQERAVPVIGYCHARMLANAGCLAFLPDGQFRQQPARDVVRIQCQEEEERQLFQQWKKFVVPVHLPEGTKLFRVDSILNADMVHGGQSVPDSSLNYSDTSCRQYSYMKHKFAIAGKKGVHKATISMCSRPPEDGTHGWILMSYLANYGFGALTPLGEFELYSDVHVVGELPPWNPLDWLSRKWQSTPQGKKDN